MQQTMNVNEQMNNTGEKVTKKDISVIAEKMKMSLESTTKGLSLFLESLQKSGLTSSLPAYQQMMSVLIQQKKWSDIHSRTEMQQIWNEIVNNSENMYQIMKAYSDIMNKLRMLNSNDSQKEKTKQIIRKEDKILNYMKTYSEFSMSELSDNLKMKKKEIKEKLDPLVKKGTLERKGRGKTLRYRLKVE